MSAAVSVHIYHHTQSGQSRFYRVTQLRTDSVHCRESVVSIHITTVLCCTYCEPVFPPDLCLYKRRKFSVHRAISYVVFQTIPRVVPSKGMLG